jgi:tetratricopeptide (TPR) repeat protein
VVEARRGEGMRLRDLVSSEEFDGVWDLAEIFDEALRELGNQLARLKRFDQGIALLQEILALNPDNADEYRADIAEMRMERAELDAGRRELETMFERNPDNYLIAMALANAQQNLLNEPDAALTTLRRAYEHSTAEYDREQLYHQLLDLLVEEARLDAAEQFWQAENDELEEADRDWIGWTKLMLSRREVERARKMCRIMPRLRAMRWRQPYYSSWGLSPAIIVTPMQVRAHCE